MPPDVRRSRADLRSTHATDHLIARAAAIEATNLRARKQRTDQVCQTIANPPYFQRRHPTQACKILYSRSPRVRYAARAKQFCNWLYGWFVARKDSPGDCPGPDWQAGPVGKKGDKGLRGERGER